MTDYVCLNCERAVCSRTNECSVPGWKAETDSGENLYCILCSPKSKATEEVIMSLQTEEPAAVNDESVDENKKQPLYSAKVKRERKFLTLSEKAEVIQISNQEGASTRKLARRFGCGRTQIVTTLKEKEKILSMWTSSDGKNFPKRPRTEKYPEINNLLWKWYIRARESNIPITGPLLQEEARFIAEELGDDTFRGSNGWLESWKQRNKITQLSVAGKKETESEKSVQSWHEQVREVTRGYAPKDVCNLDETGCFWKTEPDKTGFHENSKRCQKGQNAKGRITAVFLVNAAGGKETPIFIGSINKPRCFAKLPDISHPCGSEYLSNEKAWMQTDILLNVVGRLNERMKHENRNILLFMDTAPCHLPLLPEKFSNIKVVFLPKNMPSRSQPLQAGIITTWKIFYRQQLLRHLISPVNGEATVSDILRSVNLLMAVRWMVNAWKEVTAEAITKCFKFVEMYPEVPEVPQSMIVDDPFPNEELLDLVNLASQISKEQGVDVSSYSNIDDDVTAAYQTLANSDANWRAEVRAEILKERANHEQVAANENDKEVDAESENFDAPLQAPSVKSVKEAIGLADQLAQFADWQGDEKLSTAVLNVSQLLEESQLKSLIQSSI